jgi:hypothetical protein
MSCNQSPPGAPVFSLVKAFFSRSASVRVRCGRALGAIAGAIGRQQRLGHSSSSCALLTFDEMAIHVLCDGNARVSENLGDHVEVGALGQHLTTHLNGATREGASGQGRPADRSGRTSATHCPGPAASALRSERSSPEWPASTRPVTALERCGYATQARAHRCRSTVGLRGLGGRRLLPPCSPDGAERWIQTGSAGGEGMTHVIAGS